MDNEHTLVPLLGFEGEHHVSDVYQHILCIPLPENLVPYERDGGWLGERIEVYGWGPNVGGKKGFNIFLPGAKPVSATSALDVKLIIHDYLQR